MPGLPYLCAEAIYAVRYEMARSLDDVLSRRVRARLQDRAATLAAAAHVAQLVASELGWDQAETQRQLADFHDSIAAEQVAGLVSQADVIAHVTGIDS